MDRTNRLTIKDFATIGIYSVIVQIIQIAIGMITSPFVLYSFVFFCAPIALICAPVYMLMAVKVKKHGVLLIFNIIRGLLFALFGAPLLIIWFLISGLISELVMIGDGAYKSIKRNCIGWTISSVFYALHLVVIMNFFRPVFEKMLDKDTLNSVYVYLTSPKWIAITVVSVVICSLLGCLISKKLINKHFRRSGILQ
ncbi:MptD family putative ECF transporter S component [Clostridiaceae bacterium M8S5]|nr:MptD family putative ECF transporter S component [Clostridiaceae bacterium M8S5]